MSTRRSRRRKAGTNIFEFAVQLTNCRTTKNAVPTLPDKDCEEDIAAAQIGRLCLLTLADPPKDGPQFKKGYHIMGRIASFKKGEGFAVQPLNGLGDKDGNPKVEQSANVHLLPPAGTTVSIGDTNDDTLEVLVNDYVLANSEVNLTPAVTETTNDATEEDASGAAAAVAPAVADNRSKRKQPAAKSKKRKQAEEDTNKRTQTETNSKKQKTKKKKKKKKTPTTKSNSKKSATTPSPKAVTSRKKRKQAEAKSKKRKQPETANTKSKQTEPKSKKQKTKKKKRRPLDSASSSTAPDEAAPHLFNVNSVLASFADPRGMIHHI